VRDKVSHPYKTTSKIIVLYILIFTTDHFTIWKIQLAVNYLSHTYPNTTLKFVVILFLITLRKSAYARRLLLFIYSKLSISQYNDDSNWII
jgi:hypothetical protein